LIFFNERRQYWDIQIQIFEYSLFENISGGKNDGRGRLIWRRQDRDRFLVQAGIKLNFSEFILIFDLVFGFYCSGQKSKQNMEIKSY
jgi:hypothetical protein